LPVGGLQHRSAALASEDRLLVAQHDDLDGEVHVPATDEPDQLEDAGERSVGGTRGSLPDGRRT
jgi:hypothetical protein